MNYKSIIKVSLTISIFLGLLSFQMPKGIQKKVYKEIKSAFAVEVVTLETIEVSEEINATLPVKITGKNLYKIKSDKKTIGYAFVDKAPSKTDMFDYLILFDNNRIIKKAKVLIYREDYGGEIGSKRWLKQFIGKTSKDKLRYTEDIIAISGATISASAMTKAVSNVIKTMTILHKNTIL